MLLQNLPASPCPSSTGSGYRSRTTSLIQSPVLARLDQWHSFLAPRYRLSHSGYRPTFIYIGKGLEPTIIIESCHFAESLFANKTNWFGRTSSERVELEIIQMLWFLRGGELATRDALDETGIEKGLFGSSFHVRQGRIQVHKRREASLNWLNLDLDVSIRLQVFLHQTRFIGDLDDAVTRQQRQYLVTLAN